jgi:hypothetical protein
MSIGFAKHVIGKLTGKISPTESSTFFYIDALGDAVQVSAQS